MDNFENEKLITLYMKIGKLLQLKIALYKCFIVLADTLVVSSRGLAKEVVVVGKVVVAVVAVVVAWWLGDGGGYDKLEKRKKK